MSTISEDPEQNSDREAARQQHIAGANTLAKQMAKIIGEPASPATQSGGGDAQQPSDGGDRPSNGGPTIIDVVKHAGYVGDDGLFWEKAVYLGHTMAIQEVGITEESGKKGWRRIRTWREHYRFRCVGVSPDHRCPLPKAELTNDVPWLDPDDEMHRVGEQDYEQWHIGTSRTVVFEIELSRSQELVVPVRGEKVTTGQLLALETQWRGAPARLPNN